MNRQRLIVVLEERANKMVRNASFEHGNKSDVQYPTDVFDNAELIRALIRLVNLHEFPPELSREIFGNPADWQSPIREALEADETKTIEPVRYRTR